MSKLRQLCLVAALGVCAIPLIAGPVTLALVESDSSDVAAVQSALMATGKFSSIAIIDTTNSTPTLAQLSPYKDVLAWTNLTPADANAVGNVLAQYYSLGGHHLTVATYAFSDPWAIGGQVTTGAYAGLTNTHLTDDVSGNLHADVPNDPIFYGINLSAITYFHNPSFADPGLASGATLLADDGAGVDMIGRSANGVIDMNLYPGAPLAGNNAEFYSLVANTLAPIPEPSTLVLLSAGFLAVGIRRIRRNR